MMQACMYRTKQTLKLRKTELPENDYSSKSSSILVTVGRIMTEMNANFYMREKNIKISGKYLNHRKVQDR